MTRQRDEYARAAEREIEHWPNASIVRFETRSKHRSVVVSFKGRERFVVVSSADTKRSHLHFVTDLRVELRAMGAVRVERTPASERRKRNSAPPRAAKLPIITDPRPDGFAPLRALKDKLDAAAAPPLKPRRGFFGALADFFVRGV